MQEPIANDLELQDVVKRFGQVAAVDRLSLAVGKGEFLSLLGPSGCGKTTALRLIAGYEQADDGEILIRGRSTGGVPPYRRNIGMVFQNYALFPHLTVAENVSFGLRERRVPRETIRRKTQEALSLVQLGRLDARYPSQLSGGQQQRVALARALVIEPDLLLLDELLFFTTAGRVYRTKAYNLPEASRDAKGGHVAGLLSFQPDEQIAQVLAIRDYKQAPYLVLATRAGLVKKTRLGDYDSPRQAGVIAINFREDDDELIGAELVNADDDILLVSRRGQAIRFTADDTQLRPMGRATSGVMGMKFRDSDSLLSMSVIRAEQVAAEAEAGHAVSGEETSEADGPAPEGEVPDVVEQYVFTMTDGGFAKRTRISDYRTQSRGGLGIKAMSLTNEDRGGLVGAFIVVEGDEILSITSGGQVVRSPINDQFRATGRSTMGVKFVSPKGDDTVAVVARSVEKDATVEEVVDEAIAAEEAQEGAQEEAREDAQENAEDGATPGSVDEQDSATGEVSAEPVDDLGSATIEPDSNGDTADETGDER